LHFVKLSITLLIFIRRVADRELIDRGGRVTEYRRLGQTDLAVSILGFGASPLGDVFATTDPAEGSHAVHLAIDSGVNFFDVSPYYGLTLAEDRLGEALVGKRNKIVLATKCGRYASDRFDFSLKRIIASMRFIPPNRLLGAYACVNIALVAVGVLWPGWTGLWAICFTSFFMSLMFPTIFVLGLKRLGPNTKIGGSLIVMAIIVGAVLTPLMGLIAESHSIAIAYLVPLAAYVFVAVYAFLGAEAEPLEARLQHTNSGE
jgi:hypothetical protein